VGLCICIFDFLEIGDPYIYPGEGSSIQTVQFRLVVFRPYVGEILVGKISSSNKEGVRISLGFFDDIFVPATLLQNNSVFNSQSGVWVWTWEGNEMAMDIGEEVRRRFLSNTPTLSNFIFIFCHIIIDSFPHANNQFHGSIHERKGSHCHDDL
jgi:DNA-directed RNA polymerase III subunit RPC8